VTRLSPSETTFRRCVAAVAAAVVMAFLVAAPASAITYGTADGEGHPNVGGLVAPNAFPDGTWIYCSGTLISPTVFLTAAHCGEEGERVAVTFDTAYVAGDALHEGTFHADPLSGHDMGDLHDIAVVVFDEPVTGITPALLPEADSLSALRRGEPLAQVGYGAYEVTNEPGGHDFLYDDVRMVASGALRSTTRYWLRISQNPSTGDGGGCYGDSGGPIFLGDTMTLASITITGDAMCRAINTTYRLDTDSARAFLAQYVVLP